MELGESTRGGLDGRLRGSILGEVYSGELGCVLSDVHKGEGCVDDDSLSSVLTVHLSIF